MATGIRERVAKVVGSIHFSDWSDVQDRVTDAVVDALLEAFPQLAEEQWEYSTRDGTGKMYKIYESEDEAREVALFSEFRHGYPFSQETQLVREVVRRRVGKWEVVVE